jgi:predicted ATP-binding protein involved in virulence
MGGAAISEKAENTPFASLFSDDVALLNAEEWLLQADYAAHAAESTAARNRARKRRNEIKEVLINLLPDVDDIRFLQITEKQQKPGVEVKTPYGWVSINDLSLGYKTLVAWMVDFASRMFDRYPESKNPLAEPAVVLVDEIDLHLHPKWQRTLMGYLSERFPNTQFIATAHSPLVVQAATDANIVLLRREGDHVVIENDVKKIHGWRVDQILTSDLFGLKSARPPELDDLLAERAKLLSKSRLTKKDRARLGKLEEEIGALPTGETPEDIEAMDIIRRAAARLKKEGRETSHDPGD